jgi:acetylornithine deacetylase/succinyl-diaminopimelate desuccinylase-like protein
MKNTTQTQIQASQLERLQKTYMTLLKEFVAFKTVSTDASYKDEMKKAVNWLTSIFKENGFKVSLLKGKNTNPVVVAKYAVAAIAASKSKSKSKSASAKTMPAGKASIKLAPSKNILVYGHYDVQPAQKSDGWKNDPFVLTKSAIGDRLVARGAVDNKGQILAHMVGVFDAIRAGKLGTDVTFVIEGNEESGNDDLAGLLKQAYSKKELTPDFILISDGEIAGAHPTLDMSYRGGGNIKITYATSSNDRHSGLFGGAIPNAALELATLISKLKDNNAVSFKEFYAGMNLPSAEIRAQHAKVSKIQNIQKLAGVKTLLTEAGISAHEQIGLRPAIEISGFTGGYVGEGFKNIIPGKAEARINVRTVFPQKTEEIMSAIAKFVRANTPAHVDMSIEIESHGEAIRLDVDHQDLAGVKKLLANVYGREVIYRSIGASIPVVADFQSIFKVPMAMVSLCNDDCNMHGVDENFTIAHVEKALRFVDKFWKGN